MSDAAAQASAPAQATTDQPQAEVETASHSVTTNLATPKGSGHSCRVAKAAANGIGPPCAGGNRTGRGQISQDPANPTVLPPVNGVTVGIWIVTLPNGDEEVHWQIISGTFGGTDAIDLKVKGAPGEVGCQVTNAAPTGTCSAPLNTNSGKAHVAFVDECPGNTTNPPVNPPSGGGGSGSGGVAGAVGKGGQNGQQGTKGSSGSKPSRGSPSVAASVAAAVAGEPSGGLPVTGLAVLWLVLIGTGLVGSGALMRIRHE